MAANNTIAFETEEAKLILDRLTLKVSEIMEEKKQLQTLADQAKSALQGKAGDALQKALAEAISEQEKLAKDLTTDITTIRKKLQALEDTDSSFASIFKKF